MIWLNFWALDRLQRSLRMKNLWRALAAWMKTLLFQRAWRTGTRSGRRRKRSPRARRSSPICKGGDRFSVGAFGFDLHIVLDLAFRGVAALTPQWMQPAAEPAGRVGRGAARPPQQAGEAHCATASLPPGQSLVHQQQSQVGAAGMASVGLHIEGRGYSFSSPILHSYFSSVSFCRWTCEIKLEYW